MLDSDVDDIQSGDLPIALPGIAGALGEYEPLSDVLSLQIDPRMYVDDWSGAADKAPYIQDALDDAAEALAGVSGVTGGIEVVLPKERTGIGDQLVIPQGVWLGGRGPMATRIEALESFPEDTAMVRMGPGSAMWETGMGLRNLCLSCEDLPGVGGIYSNTWQEPAGLDHVRIRGYRGYAVHVETTAIDRVPSHGYFRRCEFFASAEGLDFDHSILIDGAANTHVFEGCTVNCNDHIVAGDTAIRAIDADIHALACHFEQYTSGLHVTLGAGNKGGLLVLGGTGHPSVTQIVRITDNAPTIAANLRPLGSAYTVNNEVTGETFAVSTGVYSNRRMHARGRARVLTQTDAQITLDTTHDLIEVDCSAATRSIILPDPTTNRGVEYTIKHVGSGNSVIVNPLSTATIDGVETKTITTAGGYLTVYSNGAEYKVSGSGGTIT